MTTPPLLEEAPEKPCPPLRTAMGSRCSRAYRSASTTCAVVFGSRTAAGDADVVYVERSCAYRRSPV